ncbi:hypothetical protein [Prosthecobacter sp.]|uniref:hypothetical protein n=1 Tax=Prosthecobacter sp. TaxID=1965333 RepID=UPI003784DA06
MYSVRSLPLWLFVIASLLLGTDTNAEDKKSFVVQVEAFLSSPWTEVHITQALMTDYGQIYGVTIELSREKPDGPVFYRSDIKAEKKNMSDDQYKRLQDVVIAAAKEVEAIQTPPEILSRVSTEEAAKLIRERKVPSGWDVEAMVIFSSKSSMQKPLNNGGRSQKFVEFLSREFYVEQRELSREESKKILGIDPYEE